MRAAGWAEDLLDFLLPSGCVACGDWVPRRTSEDDLLCGRCASRLARASWPRCPRCHAPRGTGSADLLDCRECRGWPPALAFARSAFLLRGPAADIVHALKYEGYRELAPLMATRMAEVARAQDAAPCTLLTSVPTTARRERERGYNQARLLAEALAGTLRLPVRETLARGGAVASQTSLHPAERLQNVRGVFAPAPGAADLLSGADVLLVDDVLTTGATACAAAEMLTAAGARSVTLLTFARALPGGSRGR